MSIAISIVVPVYNSEETLELLCHRIETTFNRLLIKNYEIILIDDFSRDKSYKKMVNIFNTNPKVSSIIQLAKNFGQQNAIMCGLHYARGELVATLDDDLQHPPEELEKLINKIHEGYDVVFGIPDKKMHPCYRNLGTKLIGFLFNRVCRKPQNVEVSSYRLIRKDIVKKIIKDKRSFVYLAPIIFKITKHAAKVTVRHNHREYGQSNYSLSKLIGLLIKLIIYYTWDFQFISSLNRPQYEIKDIRIKGENANETIDFGRQ